jgi:hypothetical protein
MQYTQADHLTYCIHADLNQQLLLLQLVSQRFNAAAYCCGPLLGIILMTLGHTIDDVCCSNTGNRGGVRLACLSKLHRMHALCRGMCFPVSSKKRVKAVLDLGLPPSHLPALGTILDLTNPEFKNLLRALRSPYIRYDCT